MTLSEAAVKLCRLKSLDDFPIKYKAELEEIIHTINVANARILLMTETEDEEDGRKD